MASDNGTGTTVSIASVGAFEITNVGGPSISRPSIDNTHLGTSTARTFIPGDLYDGGELTLDVHHDPALAVGMSLTALSTVIDWAGAGDTFSFDAFVTGYEPVAPLEGMMTATLTLKVTGAITGLT